MGGTTSTYSGRWDTSTYDTYRSGIAGKSINQVFQQRGIHESMDPTKIVIRESCDSDANPESTAIILGIDVTGSMGQLAHIMANEGLGTLVQGIITERPVSDPHIMVMGIGDCANDRAPIQASQFEPDIRIAEQLQNLYIEGNGGGNGWESYDLPWYFAATKTKIDCFGKRGKKGYIFTIGDEPPPPGLSSRELTKIFGTRAESGITAAESLKLAQEQYNVFHVIVEQGNYCRCHPDNVLRPWRKLLNSRAILLSDYQYMSEVILSVISVSEGVDPENVLAKITNLKIRDVVRHALFD